MIFCQLGISLQVHSCSYFVGSAIEMILLQTTLVMIYNGWMGEQELQLVAVLAFGAGMSNRRW